MAKTGTTNRKPSKGSVKQATFASQGVKNSPPRAMAASSRRALTMAAPATVSLKRNNTGK